MIYSVRNDIFIEMSFFFQFEVFGRVSFFFRIKVLCIGVRRWSGLPVSKFGKRLCSSELKSDLPRTGMGVAKKMYVPWDMREDVLLDILKSFINDMELNL